MVPTPFFLCVPFAPLWTTFRREEKRREEKRREEKRREEKRRE